MDSARRHVENQLFSDLDLRYSVFPVVYTHACGSVTLIRALTSIGSTYLMLSPVKTNLVSWLGNHESCVLTLTPIIEI